MPVAVGCIYPAVAQAHLTLAVGAGLKGEALGQWYRLGKAFWINLLKSFTVDHSAQLWR